MAVHTTESIALTQVEFYSAVLAERGCPCDAHDRGKVALN